MIRPQQASIRRLAVCMALTATSLSFGPEAVAQQSATEFRVIPLSAGIHVIQAEVALSPEERERGLMFRKELGPNQGMVFLFDAPAVECMWMRNTLIPLSVAFIDNDGRVINVEEMAAQTDDNHCAKKPARYALEMGKGWFARHGIVAGASISGLPKAR
jgi:uncharacterized membrane protein (UPF0127 family)